MPVKVPDYLTLYSGDRRLRRTHLDNLTFVSNIGSTTASINCSDLSAPILSVIKKTERCSPTYTKIGFSSSTRLETIG